MLQEGYREGGGDLNGQKDRKGRAPFALRAVLALLMLIICAFLLSRDRGPADPSSSESPEPPSTVPLSVEAETQEVDKQETIVAAAEKETAMPSPKPEGGSAETPSLPSPRPIVYDKRSYDLVSDMVYAYRHQVKNREKIISADVAALKEHDPRLGETWGGIMDYWDYANDRMELQFDALPDDLPEDDSLCLVVLGFQLLPDGGMSPEMLGRCQLALQAAEQYPNAYLAVTGGGTAYQNPDATEAGVMAAWFLEQGIEDDRLILEDRSSTTEENARNTLQILTEQYPQVKSLVIISSDYHLPLGCLLFTEAALLYGCEHGEPPYTVVSNLALRGYGLNEYKNPAEQALYVWALAKPHIDSD